MDNPERHDWIIGARTSFLRVRRDHRVTFVELFFDLVFVFAITQLSHALLANLTALGLAQTLLLFVAIWWVWIDTSWATNWLDPQTTPVRLMLFGLMLAGLVLSTSIPQAFGSRGPAFAAAYVSMQVGRCLFVMWCLHRHSAGNFRNFQRITVWRAFAGAFWIAGAVADGDARFGLWALALFLDCLAPAVGFYVPGFGRSTIADWNVEGAHMAERCGLFIIIALGESILITGATFNKLAWTAATVAAFLVAIIGSIAMWWIYFNIGAEKASRTIAATADPGRLARLAYTYLHLPIVGGIIVSAVADELVLTHPVAHTTMTTALAVLGGPALYLIGNSLFKRTIWGRLPLSHLVGLGLLALLAPMVSAASMLALGAAGTFILVIVAVWETRSLRSTYVNH
jgi:low temperature requirement protein LtrA